MDPHQYYHQKHLDETNNNNNNNNNMNNGTGVVASKSSFLCRQSSTRWIPTEEQVRILRDLYYNCGVRSPSAEQIQKISSQLRQYGKIEGKNVFYWFQNHKARERQKKRLTVDIPNSTTTTTTTTTKLPTTTTNTNTNNISPGISGPCSPAMYGTVGQMGGNGCGGSVLMESNFGENWISGGGYYNAMSSETSTGWLGFESAAATPWMYRHYAHSEQTASREIDTLPLFPVHSQDLQPTTSTTRSTTTTNVYGYFPSFYCSDDGGQPEEEGGQQHLSAAASLELSLSSCYYAPPSST